MPNSNFVDASQIKKVKKLLFPTLKNDMFDQTQIAKVVKMLQNYINWLIIKNDNEKFSLNWADPNNRPDKKQLSENDIKFAILKVVLDSNDTLEKLFYHLTSSPLSTPIAQQLKSLVISLAFKNKDEIININFNKLVTIYNGSRFCEGAFSENLMRLRQANAIDFLTYTTQYLELLEKMIKNEEAKCDSQNNRLIQYGNKKTNEILSELPLLLTIVYDDIESRKKGINNHLQIMKVINQLIDRLLTNKNVSLLNFNNSLAILIISIAMKSDDTLAIIIKHYPLSIFCEIANNNKSFKMFINPLIIKIKLLHTKNTLDSYNNANIISVVENNNIEISNIPEVYHQASIQLDNDDVNGFSSDCIIQSQILDINKYGFASKDQVELIMGNLTLLARKHAYKLDKIDISHRNEEENRLAISLKVVTQVINTLVTIFGQSDFDKKTRNDFYKELSNVLMTLKLSNSDQKFIEKINNITSKFGEQNQKITELEVKRLNELDKKEILSKQKSHIQKSSFFQIENAEELKNIQAQEIRNITDSNSIFYTFNI